MHLVLTDILTCPRCGPRFGLVLLAEEVRDRRVLEGWLGCSNCRERYRVHNGFADLRPPPAPPLDAPALPRERGEDQAAIRLAALMGMGTGAGRGFSLVVGPAARHASAIAALVEEAEVVGIDAGLAAWPEEAGVSRMAATGLPFFDRTLRGVALSGDAAAALLEEGARVLNPMGRLVVEGAPADAEARIRGAGLRVLAQEGGTVVAGWAARG
ncbi:MAG TPA: Trm112 family protein [Longimicrobiales bacterium]|nr:Trm112 family protein [Longimicrobiales bacterium]